MEDIPKQKQRTDDALEIYPVLPYGRLNEVEKYNDQGKKQQNLIDKIFIIYKYDELGDIIKKMNDNFYLQFMTKYIHLNKDYEELNHSKYIHIVITKGT